MNYELKKVALIKSAIDIMKDDGTVVIITDKSDFTIVHSSEYVDGTDGYMSEVLGMCVYQDIEEIVRDLFRYIQEKRYTLIEVIYD